MELVEEFQSIVELLETEGIEYAVCGGFAVTLLGAPRLTRDIDFLILDEDSDRVKGLLEEKGYSLGKRFPIGMGTDAHREVERRTKVGDDVVTVDLLLVQDSSEPAWSSRIRVRGHGLEMSVVSREGLAAMKRKTGRAKDLEDLRNLGIE